MNFVSSKNQVDYNKWADFVNSHPSGNFFQTPELFELYSLSKNYEPIVIIGLIDDNVVSILLAAIITEEGIKKYFSKRAIIYGGPLALNNDCDIVRDTLLEYNKVIENRVIYTQIRNLSDQSPLLHQYNRAGFAFTEHLNFIVPISDYKTFKGRISESKFRQIKKGLKTGAVIEQAKTEGQVLELYLILKNLYSRKIKKPLSELEFFLNFFNIICKRGKGVILLVLFEGKVIGGIICPIFRNRVIYEWYIGGLDEEFKSCYPSILATYASLNYALEHKINCFDFLGAGEPDKEYGIREFKSKFGGDLVQFGRFKKTHKRFLMFIGRLGFWIYNKI